MTSLTFFTYKVVYRNPNCMSALALFSPYNEPIELSYSRASELPGACTYASGAKNMVMNKPAYYDHISAVSFQDNFHVRTCSSFSSPYPSNLTPIHSFSMEDVLESQITS